MPFGFDLTQVFQMLMAKTMWDVRLGNTQFGGGFAGGNFMNSCWGNGFQPMSWGDSFNFNGAGVSSAGGNAEERTERIEAQEKFNDLKGVVEDYIKTLKDSNPAEKHEKTLLKEKLKDCGSYSAEHYEDLKDLYNEYKTKIQTKLKTGVVVSETTKKAAEDVAKALNSNNPKLNAVLKLDSEKKTTAELADGIDAVGLLNSLQTTKKKSYKALYETAKSNAKPELDKLTKALYSNLAAEAAKLKKETVLSEETAKVLEELCGEEADNATAENVDQLYYWVRKAKAEINNSKYANLQEDFPDDMLLGAANTVEETEKALKAEGLDTAAIVKATVKTDFSNMDSLSAMQSLHGEKIITPLPENLLAQVKQYMPKAKQVWYDTNSRNNYQTIRFIDENGDLKCLYNVAVVKGQIKRINKKEVKVGEGLSPENIKAVSDKIKELKSSSSEYKEVTSASDLDRIFKNTKDNKLYKVNSEGELVLASGANKRAVDKNAANYAQKLYNMDKTTPDILVNKINKDNVVDILLEYRNKNGNYKKDHQGVYFKVCSASGNSCKNLSQHAVNRIPKALMRKALELNLGNSQEYKALAVYFKASGTPSYSNGKISQSDNYMFNKRVPALDTAQSIEYAERDKIDKMINALLDVIVKKLNGS